jgi:predicted HicB family RNase H-like nuclease
MDAMEFKGYRGSVRYSAEDKVLHGRVLGIDDVVSFEGADVAGLERAFHEAVEDYLATCRKMGRAPDREYSGRIPLRIDGALHRRLAIAADSEAKSLNSWLADKLAVLEAATRAEKGLARVAPRPARPARAAAKKARRKRA